MSSSVTLRHTPAISGTASQLPSSKSISNRVLILKALSGNQSVVSNLSAARDTRLMLSLIDSPDKTIDVLDAGTTMRFLTAYFSLTGKNKIMTGTARMKQRPIALLVDALRELGVTISYLEAEGFPSIEIKGFAGQKAAGVTIPGNVSSQYISALMMTAPLLPKGLTIHLKGKIGSRPYIEMTAALMKQFGITPDFQGQVIHIPSGRYTGSPYTVEADWSAASYWYAFTALAESATINMPNVARESLQGDRVITEVMEKLGVKAVFDSGTATLHKQPAEKSIRWDFTDCPDLAQTVLPVCAAKGIAGSFTGLESLRIKETDRIAALQTELAKIGAVLEEPAPGSWNLIPGKFEKRKITIDTYHDHRMAMGLAPLVMLMDLEIESPDVVNKSYPGFWEDLKAVGIPVE